MPGLDSIGDLPGNDQNSEIPTGFRVFQGRGDSPWSQEACHAIPRKGHLELAGRLRENKSRLIMKRNQLVRL